MSPWVAHQAVGMGPAPRPRDIDGPLRRSEAAGLALNVELRRRDGKEDLDGIYLDALSALADRLEVAHGAAVARVEAARARALAARQAAAARRSAAAAVSEDFVCPISLEVMRDPVMASDGHSCAAASIDRRIGATRNAARRRGVAATNPGAIRRFDPGTNARPSNGGSSTTRRRRRRVSRSRTCP